MDKPRLLIVEDEEDIRTQLCWALSEEYEITVAGDRDSALDQLATSRPHLVTLDLGLPPLHSSPDEGLRLLKEILDLDPLTRVIVITGHDDQSSAVQAVDMGAFDYYLKPVDITELKVILGRALHLRMIDEGNSGVSPMPGATIGTTVPEILGSSQRMFSVMSTVGRTARSDVTVLITGESGTGKELVARAIHAKSTRSLAPFVPINCGAIPETLIESELFGHEKGAFTGAHVARKGRLELADGGTIFLDEISELPPSLQVKLLRFLQEREIERIGGRARIPLEVRIIAASNIDLRKATIDGSFREDLYYRLAVVVIPMPPLRDRGDDSVLLAKFFLKPMSQEMGRRPRRFSQAAEGAIRAYAWPGNVRELENKVKRAIIMARGRVITPADLDLPSPSTEGSVLSLRMARQEVERKTLIAALQRHRGNISRAASEIGVSRPTLHGLLHKHNLEPAEFRQR
ncbi:MAG: PEP-CTERM-box response regulator transcription factor [Candidatus Methylomirabilales bacterium]